MDFSADKVEPWKAAINTWTLSHPAEDKTFVLKRGLAAMPAWSLHLQLLCQNSSRKSIFSLAFLRNLPTCSLQAEISDGLMVSALFHLTLGSSILFSVQIHDFCNPWQIWFLFFFFCIQDVFSKSIFSSYLNLPSDLCPKTTFQLLILYVVGHLLQVHKWNSKQSKTP